MEDGGWRILLSGTTRIRRAAEKPQRAWPPASKESWVEVRLILKILGSTYMANTKVSRDNSQCTIKEYSFDDFDDIDVEDNKVDNDF